MALPEFKDCIFYEIYPNSFKDSNGDGFGDLQGIISKLSYIKELGFNAIWLNPIYDSPFKDGGYDVTDPFKVSPRFGTNADLKELIQKMHSLDMRLFLDLVPGHMSTLNEKFIQSGKAYPNESSDLFIWNDNVWNLEPNYRLISGMYDRNGCFMVNFFAHQPAINYGFNKIRFPSWQKSYKDVKAGKEYLESIMKFWLDFGADGFRVDMADSLVKNDDDKEATIWLWQQIREDLHKQGVKEFYLTSEWSDPKKALKAGFDSDFVLDHWHNFSHRLFRQQEEGFKRPLLDEFNQELFDIFASDLQSRIRDAKKEGRALSVISGNHDTWRIANFLSGNSLKLAYLFILTMPGVPYIYYGDEIGMHTDTSMPSFEGGYQRTGSRLPMRFDSSKNAGFSSSDKTFLPTLTTDETVEEEEKDPYSLLNEIKKLISIRKEKEDLRSEEFEMLAGKMAYKRGKIVVLINLFDKEQSFSLKGRYKPIYSLERVSNVGDDFVLAPHGGAILEEID